MPELDEAVWVQPTEGIEIIQSVSNYGLGTIKFAGTDTDAYVRVDKGTVVKEVAWF